MKFSKRTSWNTEESDLARAHRLRLEKGLPIADLTASNPTRCGFDYDPALLSALADTRALVYDPQPRGLAAARETVCRYYAGLGAEVQPDQVVLTTSTSEAYSFLFKLLCDPESEILVPLPSYPLFDFLADLDDVRIKPAPFVYDHGWQLDLEGLRRAITPATRAIVLVHPNNPTGHFTKEWEARELANICREFDLALIVDEVFLDYAFDLSSRENRSKTLQNDKEVSSKTHEIVADPSSKQQSFAAGFSDANAFIVSGLSKIAGLPQMKAAWIVALGPQSTQALERLEVIADTFLSMNAPIQYAIGPWLDHKSHIQRQIRQRVQRNLSILDERLVQAQQTTRLKAEGGWYAMLRIPALQPDETTVHELLDEGVWVHPGYFFGMPRSGWLVISLLAPESEFASGVTTLVNYLIKNQHAQ